MPYVFRKPYLRAWRRRALYVPPSVAVAVTGAGSLFAAGVTSLQVGLPIPGAGSLYAAQVPSVSTSQSLALTGAGASFSESTAAPAITQPVTGTGIAFGAGTFSLQVAGGLPNAGTEYSASPSATGVAVSASAGSQYSVGTLAPAATLLIPGSGSLSSAGVAVPQVTPPLDGGLGILYAGGTFAPSAAPKVTGVGSLNSAQSFGVGVTVPSAGSLTASGILVLAGSGSLNLLGSGSIIAAATFTPGPGDLLVGAGSLYSASSFALGIAPLLAGVGSLYGAGSPAEALGLGLGGAGSLFNSQLFISIVPVVVGAGTRYASLAFSLGETLLAAGSLYAISNLSASTSSTQTVPIVGSGTKYSLSNPIVVIGLFAPSSGSLYSATSPALALIVISAGVGSQYSETSLGISGAQVVTLIGEGTQYGVLGATQLTFVIPSLEMTILPSASSPSVGFAFVSVGSLFASHTVTTAITLPPLVGSGNLYSAGSLALPVILTVSGAGSIYAGGFLSTSGSQIIPLPATGSGTQYAAFGATQLTIYIPSLEMTILPSASTFILGGGIISFPGARSPIAATSFGLQVSIFSAGSLYTAGQLALSTAEIVGVVGSGSKYSTGQWISSAISLVSSAGSLYGTGLLSPAEILFLSGAGSLAAATLPTFAFVILPSGAGSLFAATTYNVTIQYPVVVGILGEGSLYSSGILTYQTTEIAPLSGAGSLNSAGPIFVGSAIVGAGSLYSANSPAPSIVTLLPSSSSLFAISTLSIGTSQSILLANTGLSFTSGVLGYVTSEAISVLGANTLANVGALYAAPSLPSIQLRYAAGSLATGVLIGVLPQGAGSIYSSTTVGVTTDTTQTIPLFGAGLQFSSGTWALEIDESLLFTGAGILASGGALYIAMAMAGSRSPYAASTVLPGITVSILGQGSVFSITTLGVSTSISQTIQLPGSGFFNSSGIFGYATSELLLLSGMGSLTSASPLYVAGALIGSRSLYAKGILIPTSAEVILGSSSLYAVGLLTASISESVSETISQFGIGSLYAAGIFSYITNESMSILGIGSQRNSGTLIFTSSNVYPMAGAGTITNAGAPAEIIQIYLSGQGSLFAATPPSAPAQVVTVNLTGSGSPLAAGSMFEVLGIGLAGSGTVTAAATAALQIVALAAGVGSHSNLSSLVVATAVVASISGASASSASGTLGEILGQPIPGVGVLYETNGLGAAQITSAPGARVVSSAQVLGPVGIAISVGIGVEFTAGNFNVVVHSGVAQLVGASSNDNIGDLGALGQGFVGTGSPVDIGNMAKIYAFIPRNEVHRIARRIRQRVRIVRMVA